MSRWLDRVAGVIDVWYPGEEGGHAVADVLFGDYNPAGRLPITFPMSEGQLPLDYNHKPTGRGDDYLDLTGIAAVSVRIRAELHDVRVLGARRSTPADDLRPAGTRSVRCTVTNTGRRAGDEVVQLYIRDVLASVARPVMQLDGFQRVHLEPGESTDRSVHARARRSCRCSTATCTGSWSRARSACWSARRRRTSAFATSWSVR